jgi:prepilin-type N-terminal cleavage/methylation domain-containing protein
MHRSKYPSLIDTAGFTLIELLLALVMFATIAGVIFASFAAVADGVDKGRQSADTYRVGRSALQRLLQEVGTAVQLQTVLGQHDPRTAFQGEDGQTDGWPRDRITFVTIPYRRFSARMPENEFCDVSYYITENAQGQPALFRTEDCTLDEERQEGGTTLELTDMAVGLDVTYFDAQEEHERWPPGSNDEVSLLPCRVRVALTLQDAQQRARVFLTTVSLLMRETCEDETARR